MTCCTALPPSACAHLPSDSVTVTLTCLHCSHSSIWLMGTGSCSRAEGGVDAQYWDWTELPWQQYTRQAQPPATPRLLPDRLPTLPLPSPLDGQTELACIHSMTWRTVTAYTPSSSSAYSRKRLVPSMVSLLNQGVWMYRPKGARLPS